MGSRNQSFPFLFRQAYDLEAAVHSFASVASAVDESPSVSRVMQNTKHLTMSEYTPHQISFLRPRVNTSWKQQALALESPYCGHRRSGAAERIKQQPQSVFDLLVRIEPQSTFGVVDQSNRRLDHQFTASGFVEDSAL